MNLVFDIGGTFTRCAGVSEGTIVRKEKAETPKDFGAGILTCKKLAEAVLAGECVDGVAVGVAGTLDREKRRIFAIPQLPLWNGCAFAEELEKVFGVSVTVRNDAELAGLGEAVYGAGRGKEIVAYITVGTSVGGSRIVSGRVDAQAHGFEPGHQILFEGGAEKRLYQVVSGATIEKETGKKPSDISDEYFWKEQSEKLAVGISNAVLFWSPDIVVLGGSVGQKMDLSVIEKEMQKNLGDIFQEIPPVVFAELGDDSGLWGGVGLVSR